jgi:hypothetical protein
VWKTEITRLLAFLCSGDEERSQKSRIVKLGCKGTATRRNKERAVWCGAIRSMGDNHDAMACDEMAASGGRSDVVWLRGLQLASLEIATWHVSLAQCNS